MANGVVIYDIGQGGACQLVHLLSALSLLNIPKNVYVKMSSGTLIHLANSSNNSTAVAADGHCRCP